MLPDPDDGHLLWLEFATRFVLDGAGRLLYENDPAHTLAPRLYLAGCRAGNLVRFRHDVDAGIAEAVQALAADEPALWEPGSTPVHLAEYVRLLSAEAPVERWDAGLIWTFPDRLAYRHAAALVGSETPAGDRLLARIAGQGMPAPLAAMGFAGVGGLLGPWCAALHDDEIASIAYSARLGPAAAETGVVTVPALRGQGYAAAATAGWAAHPAHQGRPLFYSTRRTNLSSQRVTRRLGLRFLGASLTMT